MQSKLNNILVTLSLLRLTWARQVAHDGVVLARQQHIDDWRHTLRIPVPGIDETRDGFTDAGLAHLLERAPAGYWKPTCLDILPELQRLQARPAPSTLALRDMVASEAGTFSVADIDEDPMQELFPAGAPLDWSDHKARARFALTESILANRKRWERWERPFDERAERLAEERGYLSASEMAAADGDYEMAGEFDETVGSDIDDSRWEQPGYVLDPNWSTCPAVVDQAEDLNDSRRYVDADGAQDIERNIYDRKAELQRYGRHIDSLLKFRMSKRRREHITELRRGCQLAIDAEVDQRIKSIERNADNTAWMAHGTAMRGGRFLVLAEMMVKGQTTMLLRKKGALGFLSFLRHCWDDAVEHLNKRGIVARDTASAENYKTMAAGRDYVYSRPHMTLLRTWRKDILKAWSWVSRSATTYELGVSWLLRVAGEAKRSWLGQSCGSRSEEAFLSGHSAQPNLLADVAPADVRQLGLGESGTKLAYDGGAEAVTHSYWRALGVDHDPKVSGGAPYTAIERINELVRYNCSNPRREERTLSQGIELWPVSPVIARARLVARQLTRAALEATD